MPLPFLAAAAAGRYFSREGKVTKRSRKGAVPLAYPLNDGGILFCARGTVCLAGRTAVRLRVFCVCFSVRIGGPYRFKRGELPVFFR